MALEVSEELIPLERCLKKDHAKLKNGRPGTKAFEQSRLIGPKRSLRAEQHAVVAQVLSVGLGSQRNWIFLLNCCCSVRSASLGRGSGLRGQGRRGGEHLETSVRTQESQDWWKGRKATRETPGKITGWGTARGAQRVRSNERVSWIHQEGGL